jgi:hypothetical protein
VVTGSSSPWMRAAEASAGPRLSRRPRPPPSFTGRRVPILAHQEDGLRARQEEGIQASSLLPARALAAGRVRRLASPWNPHPRSHRLSFICAAAIRAAVLLQPTHQRFGRHEGEERNGARVWEDLAQDLT